MKCRLEYERLAHDATSEVFFAGNARITGFKRTWTLADEPVRNRPPAEQRILHALTRVFVSPVCGSTMAATTVTRIRQAIVRRKPDLDITLPHARTNVGNEARFRQEVALMVRRFEQQELAVTARSAIKPSRSPVADESACIAKN